MELELTDSEWDEAVENMGRAAYLETAERCDGCGTTCPKHHGEDYKGEFRCFECLDDIDREACAEEAGEVDCWTERDWEMEDDR